MKNFSKIAIFNVVLFCGHLYADLYDEMITAIKESNCKRVQEVVQLTTFSQNERQAFLILAQEKLQECRLCRENRRFNVRASVALKASAGITFIGGFIGDLIDPRGSTLPLPLITLIPSPLILAVLAVPFINREARAGAVGLTMIGTLAAAATYGLIKLEKYFWKRAAEIDLALDQAIERAGDCKNLLIKLFGTQQIDLC